MAKESKRYKEIVKTVDEEKSYSLDEALKIVKKNATASFDETVELVVKLGVDVRHSDQMVRGVAPMPKGLGKDVKVAVFAKGEKAEEAQKAGADLVGLDELIEDINKGNIDFDTCIATPDVMAQIGKVAKVLGPKGLMPNPKLGTVTLNVESAVKAAKSGQVEYRTEKAGIVHAGVGKASFSEGDLTENIRSLIDALEASKPSGTKGVYLKKATLTSTMGVGVSVDVATLKAA